MRKIIKSVLSNSYLAGVKIREDKSCELYWTSTREEALVFSTHASIDLALNLCHSSDETDELIVETLPEDKKDKKTVAKEFLSLVSKELSEGRKVVLQGEEDKLMIDILLNLFE